MHRKHPIAFAAGKIKVRGIAGATLYGSAEDCDRTEALDIGVQFDVSCSLECIVDDRANCRSRHF